MAITLKSKKEIEILREGGKRLANIMQELISLAKPGISTWELDQIAEKLILGCGGKSSFKGYQIKETKVPYPSSICASLNSEVVHGIPKKEVILKKGDILSIDAGMQFQGLFVDMAFTVGIGVLGKEAQKLLQATKEALDLGNAAIRPGAHLGDIGHAIETCLRKNSLGIVRDLAGLGVGYKVHEDPLIPNFGKSGTGLILKQGMVLAIEPMATLGSGAIELARDQWTFRASDNALSAHFEHTVAVSDDGVEILTKLA